MRVFIFVILLGFVPAFAQADSPTTPPRIDLYQRIKKDTGVSLKEALLAVEGKDSSSVFGLKFYSKKIGTKGLKESIQTEIDHRQSICKKKKGTTCSDSTEELRSHLDYLTDLEKSLDTKNGFEKLYYSLVIYNFSIKSSILKPEFDDWSKNCSSQESINSRVCQEKLFWFHTLADISSDISLLAYKKSEDKNSNNKDLISSISRRISLYEK